MLPPGACRTSCASARRIVSCRGLCVSSLCPPNPTCARSQVWGFPKWRRIIQKAFRNLWRFYSLLFRGFFVVFSWLFVALFCLEKQCSGLFRYFFVVFSWLFRGPSCGQILRVLALEQSSESCRRYDLERHPLNLNQGKLRAAFLCRPECTKIAHRHSLATFHRGLGHRLSRNYYGNNSFSISEMWRITLLRQKLLLHSFLLFFSSSNSAPRTLLCVVP